MLVLFAGSQILNKGMEEGSTPSYIKKILYSAWWTVSLKLQFLILEY